MRWVFPHSIMSIGRLRSEFLLVLVHPAYSPHIAKYHIVLAYSYNTFISFMHYLHARQNALEYWETTLLCG